MLIVVEGDLEFDEGRLRFTGTHYLLFGQRQSASVVLRTTGGLLDQDHWRLYAYSNTPLAVTLSKINFNQKTFRSTHPQDTK